MEKFEKRDLNRDNFPESDKGIKISQLLTLIDESPYYKDVLEYFDIESDSNDMINISGAKTLFTVIKSLNNRFKKVDLISNLKNIYFDHKGDFYIKFNDLSKNDYFDNYKKSAIKTKPIHSGERDFFSSLYEIDKYARKLKNKGYYDILDKNLELLKTKDNHIRKYRLLHDIKEDDFYLRAIVSKDKYFDYDNSVAVVIALLKLYFEMQQSETSYELHTCEFNQSFIRMYFKTSEVRELKGIGSIENMLQISNDEIKREALRFSNICSITFMDSRDNEQNLFIKPKDINSRILSIPHSTGPDKAFVKLENYVKSDEVFDKLFNEIKTINKIKDHNQIVHLVKMKIDKSTTEEIKRNKEELIKILLKEVSTSVQLLEMFNKLMLLKGLEIDAKEYLRYLIYEALIDRK